MTTMSPSEARAFWKALMDNASSLIEDARILLDVGSHGRARSLTVLAQEELGKALWIYDDFFQAWNKGSEEAEEVERLTTHGRSHTKKYLEAVIFGDELAQFWGDDRTIDRRREGESWEDYFGRREQEATTGASEANLAKQRGFYVDRDSSGAIHRPSDITPDQIADDLQTAAQVMEMLLIKDHSRMKFDAETPYDSTHEQQWRLMPISHPEDFQGFVNRVAAPPEDSGEAPD